MSRAVIRAWMDREGRVWMETGQKQPKTGEMIIELLNGHASGSVAWVNAQFGPLERLGVQREPKDNGAST
ncbi:hypothetical protein ETD86_44180 [Nonomuraea turkmeniaca]|uniref:Uncharacterized protein n=1 Tax=Nonomuraea turkmeniaca TaxID=103838 RepID=A0A5S4FJP8_9ACTN|nr:hypothetical protein [Nonomuraea turkmeniaca]TMR09305.1 hypothetical protein ETD86_44180 [Nonomuraea turkmeniaca]